MSCGWQGGSVQIPNLISGSCGCDPLRVWRGEGREEGRGERGGERGGRRGEGRGEGGREGGGESMRSVMCTRHVMSHPDGGPNVGGEIVTAQPSRLADTV